MNADLVAIGEIVVASPAALVFMGPGFRRDDSRGPALSAQAEPVARKASREATARRVRSSRRRAKAPGVIR